MLASPHVEVATDGGAVTHDTIAAELVDLLVADDEWVRREFDVLVAAGWSSEVPPRPAPEQGARWPRRPGYEHCPTPVRHLREPLHLARATTHPRGPPEPLVPAHGSSARRPVGPELPAGHGLLVVAVGPLGLGEVPPSGPSEPVG